MGRSGAIVDKPSEGGEGEGEGEDEGKDEGGQDSKDPGAADSQSGS